MGKSLGITLKQHQLLKMPLKNLNFSEKVLTFLNKSRNFSGNNFKKPQPRKASY
jgi:hypothetical protein